jgi:hypothetical protein
MCQMREMREMRRTTDLEAAVTSSPLSRHASNTKSPSLETPSETRSRQRGTQGNTHHARR